MWERNAPDDTFGFGVVFSDETLGGIEHADPVVVAEMRRHMAHWDDIDVHHRGAVTTSGGHGFSAMSRKELLRILQQRCADLGVTVHFRTPAPPAAELMAAADLAVAADGVNSVTRTALADAFGPQIALGRSRYMWLATDRVLEAFTFDIRETPHGVVQLHGYPYSGAASTIIVEIRDSVFERLFGEVAATDLAPGENDVKSIEIVRELFAGLLDGHDLFANGSRWLSFPTLTTRTWRHRNLVLLGDAAHTAHFSIGSGTKLAMEDALALAACLHERGSVRRRRWRPTRRSGGPSSRPPSARRRRARRGSRTSATTWTRSRRSSRSTSSPGAAGSPTTTCGCATRSSSVRSTPGSPGSARCARRCSSLSASGTWSCPTASSSRRWTCTARSTASPASSTSSTSGARRSAGPRLVMTEMVCVSPAGRITPGCGGLYTAEQEAAWRRIVEFVHAESDARIGVQLGHSGRKGSTRLMWEGIDEPLPEGNWEVVAPSPIPYSPANTVPRELTVTGLTEIRGQFVAAARAAARAGFDLLELHAAHGYLLSSFVSPLSNSRTDAYGGCLENRLRFPLEVFDAVREVWTGPMSVRISATDWHEGGTDVEDAVQVARAFAAHGADAIDVSTGQVVSGEKPEFGRSYQTPYADRIRNDVPGVAVIAVGAISSWDDVNSILLAGRADLCALARPHLYDPHWTLHAAAEQEYTGPGAVWPLPFRAGSRRPQTGRRDDPRPRLDLVRDGSGATRHARWR